MKFYLCDEKTLCITDHCQKGKELKNGPKMSAPVESRIPSPDDPEWGDPCTRAVNEPIMDQMETEIEFLDGTKMVITGHVELKRGCELSNTL